MTTDHTDQLTAQIERFDQMQKELGDGFDDEIFQESVDLTYTHSFEAVLVESPRIVAVADVGFDGRIERVRVQTEEGRSIEVAQGSGLWAAMVFWLDDMRKTWPDGD